MKIHGKFLVVLLQLSEPDKLHGEDNNVVVVVVVVVVMTSPSGSAYMGGQMSRRYEEFHQTLNPEGSISPS